MEVEIEHYNYYPRHDGTDWNIEESTYDVANLSYQDFFANHLVKNTPCIVKNISTNWECSEKWVRDHCINFDYLIKKYGYIEAPVADCNNILDYSQRTSQMKVGEYMKYLQSDQKENLLYLKDLHLKKVIPDDNFYMVPKLFSSDWLNEYAQDNDEDDFKFVYMGPKGSWTPLHVDVYSSFSWSVNIIGRKKWILFAPGEENKLVDEQNKLKLRFDPIDPNVKHYEIIQDKGDAIFVPSGWYHQVENQLDTISINHNWNNGCNIECMLKTLKKSLLDVEHEICQFRESPDFSSQCQILLKALCGANFDSFLNFVSYIAKKRLKQLRGELIEPEEFILGINHVLFDLKMVYNVMESMDNTMVNDDFQIIKNEILNAMNKSKC